MRRLCSWLARIVHPHDEAAAARERVLRDEKRVELHAERIERSADALEQRVVQNHISARVEQLLRGVR